ncbi:MAG: TolC family protein [Pirellulaceae bacterium]|nr:TolC family protein [Pirellulaceae bacterium]
MLTSLDGSAHKSRPATVTVIEPTGAAQAGRRDLSEPAIHTNGNPLRPRQALESSAAPLLSLRADIAATNIQQVGSTTSESDRQRANQALWQVGAPSQNHFGVGVDPARQPVTFAPSFLDPTATGFESSTNGASVESDQLRLWGDPLATVATQPDLTGEIAGRFFSKSLFQHHRTILPLALATEPGDVTVDPTTLDKIAGSSNKIPALPVVTALPPTHAGAASTVIVAEPVKLAGESVRTPDPLLKTQESVFKQSNDELPEWWLARVADVQRNQAVLRQVGLSNLIDQAIAQSPKIRMLQRRPAMAETETERERSVFDPVLRLDTKYRDDADPVANQLQTGGPPVLKDNTWAATAGVQRRFANGTTADLFQRLGFKNSNSLFFSPQDQGTATVGVDINHPLLRNSGRDFNRSLIVLAELQGQVSFYEYQTDLQREMVEIGTLYWQLLHARQVVLQTQRSRDRAKQVLDLLTARTNYDASANQVAAAKSDVSQRETELLDSQRSLREIEVLLRDKINDADFASDQDVELIPNEFFDEVFPQEYVALNDAIDRALVNRWELQREDSRTQAADRQLFMSRCGLAPKLDLVLGVYSSGLAGGTGIERAWTNQFGSATPGYYGGIEYEVPYGRRQAKAAVQRDQLQKQQAMDAYQVARNEVITQVKTAHIRVETAIQSRAAAAQAVLDMRAALEHMQQRWEAAAFVEGNAIQGTSPSIALEQLLTGQRRLQDAEVRLASADLQLALTRQALLRAMGEVLQTHVATVAPAELPVQSTSSGLAPDRQ